GSLWLGQNRDAREMAVLHGGQATLVSLPVRLPGVDARAMTEDATGNLWVGTRGDGLYRLREGQQTRFGKREGLSSEFILSLYADADGAVWIGTREGFNRFQSGKFDVVITKVGIAYLSFLSID